MKKSALINIVFNVLGKAMPFVCKNDSRANELFFSLPKDIKINMGIYGEGAYISLEKNENQIIKSKDKFAEPDLEVLFKTRKATKMVLLGQISVSQSFARHDILLKGDINTAVRLVRIIDIVEYYLFPRFITHKFLPKMKKELSSFKVYGALLFSNAKKCVIGKENQNGGKTKVNKTKIAKNSKENGDGKQKEK